MKKMAHCRSDRERETWKKCDTMRDRGGGGETKHLTMRQKKRKKICRQRSLNEPLQARQIWDNLSLSVNVRTLCSRTFNFPPTTTKMQRNIYPNDSSAAHCVYKGVCGLFVFHLARNAWPAHCCCFCSGSLSSEDLFFSTSSSALLAVNWTQCTHTYTEFHWQIQ